MTIWEWQHCIAGYNKANSPGHRASGDAITDDEYDQLVKLGEAWNGER